MLFCHHSLEETHEFPECKGGIHAYQHYIRFKKQHARLFKVKAAHKYLEIRLQIEPQFPYIFGIIIYYKEGGLIPDRHKLML